QNRTAFRGCANRAGRNGLVGCRRRRRSLSKPAARQRTIGPLSRKTAETHRTGRPVRRVAPRADQRCSFPARFLAARRAIAASCTGAVAVSARYTLASSTPIPSATTPRNELGNSAPSGHNPACLQYRATTPELPCPSSRELLGTPGGALNRPDARYPA